MQRYFTACSLIGLVALVGCTSRAASTSADALVSAARSFMTGYGRDLSHGNREALVRRYDRRGAFFVGEGTKEYWPNDSISSWYRHHWLAPAFVEFRNLSYEPLGDSAVAVIGQFRWTAKQTTDTAMFAYTAILLKQNEHLVIRVEDESRPALRL